MAGTISGLPESARAVASDRPAVIAEDGSARTYAELARSVNGVAAAVVAAGVAPDRAVAVVLPNGRLMAEVFLGVAGAAACAPLNPAYPEPELAYYFDDLRAAALVTDGCSPVAIEVAEPRGIPILRPPFAAADAAPPAAPDDVALILHTSGTTGRPKQVRLTHANLTASAASIATTLHLTSDDVCVNVMPLFHIHGLVGVLLSSLTAGASVVCTGGFDPTRFLDTAVRHDATWYSAVPTIHHAVLAAARQQHDVAAQCTF